MLLNKAQDLSALFGSAVDYQLRGRREDALKLYDTIIQASPGMAAAHCNRGIVLQELGRLDEALRSYEEAIKSEPANADAHYNKGIALSHMNRIPTPWAVLR